MRAARVHPDPALFPPLTGIWQKALYMFDMTTGAMENQAGKPVFRVYFWTFAIPNLSCQLLKVSWAANPTGFESNLIFYFKHPLSIEKGTGMKAGKHRTMHERENSLSLKRKRYGKTQNDF